MDIDVLQRKIHLGERCWIPIGAVVRKHHFKRFEFVFMKCVANDSEELEAGVCLNVDVDQIRD